jgi:Lrp/AsnC family transcriptional regulator, regulator for asnA, asnC and gidA
MFEIDAIDVKLIRLLQCDPLRSRKILAAELGISPSSVRRRIRVLTKEGVIRIVAVIDPRQWGLSLCAQIGVNVDIKHFDSVIKSLCSLDQVKNVAAVTGRYDILIYVRVATIEELSSLMRDKIARIDGVLRTQIFLCNQDVENQESFVFADMKGYVG